MRVLTTKLKVSSREFKENRAHHKKLADELHARQQRAAFERPEKVLRRQEERGKLLVRDRIDAVLDPGSPFLELSSLAAYGMYDDEAPSAGVVTGIGQVHGREVLFVANDPTVKGGTYYPVTVKKHVRAQRIAEENGLPCLYLVDSGGAFLPLQDEVFPDRDHFGRIFYQIARMSSKKIPQLSAVLGSCTAGGAYIPAMSDEAVIVKGNGTIFLGGPPLVKAATGAEVSAEELGGADVHTRTSGVADHYAADEPQALEWLREMVFHLNRSKRHELSLEPPEEPRYPPEELYGVLPKDSRQSYDARELVMRLVDGSRFAEFKANYAPTVVCGFAHWMGMPVGIVANNGLLFSESALKATHFIELCGQRALPLLFLQNITGFMVGKEYENKGIAKDGAKLVTAVSTVPVPRFTLIVGGSHGAGNYAMCGRGYDPRFLFTWPNSRISVMGGEQAANVLWTVRAANLDHEPTAEEEAEFKRPTLEKYERESSPYYATARLWDDGVLDPVQTRTALGLAISSSLNAPWPEGGYGTFRM